ncbi:MAG: winged helix-turn-helix domain-containing protein [Oligoflexia bacterium]|nr:winged helix-turn-helix domain-containing protein [Oligoflexia bacterium]
MAVNQWIRKCRSEGRKALQSKPKPGAPSRLSVEKKYQILELLYPGAEAWGFVGDIWTCSRIGNVIERQFGISYHRHHIAKIMKELNWTSHGPRVRALQRNEQAI